MNTKKSIVELLTVVVESCSTLESVESINRKSFMEKTQKLLSLLYMKASLLSSDSEIGDYFEHFVTEKDWELIRQSVESKLGSLDNRIRITEPDNYTNGDSVETYLSECFADIYQDARNFAEQCKDASDEVLETATAEFILNFKLYWGTRALAILTEFHCMLYASDTEIDKDED